MNYSAEISPGTIIDRRYRVEKTLGQGGFGRTYLVSDSKRFGDYFVLKEFVPNNADQYVVDKSRELFEREARVLNQLTHPQIPKFFGWFEENERLFFAQAYIDGRTYSDLLRERQQKNKVFSEVEVLDLLYNLLPVLNYIHSHKIVHRDISPDNIMFCSRQKKPVLIDFGVVNQHTANQLSTIGNQSLSQGTTVGKVGYSPPEQIMRGICFPNSDLYALGVTTLVLLTGKNPVDLFDNATNQWRWQDCLELKSNLSEALPRMLAQIPEKRYQSAQEVLECLSATVVSEPRLTPNPNVAAASPEDTYVIPANSSQPVDADATQIASAPPTQQSINSPVSKVSPTQPIKTIVIGGITTLLLFLGGLWWQSPKISGLCHTLNNCSQDIEFQDQYNETIEQVTPTLALIENPQKIKTLPWDDLQAAQQTLEKSIQDLESIPSNVEVYPQAQQSLHDFQAQLEQVATEITARKDKPLW